MEDAPESGEVGVAALAVAEDGFEVELQEVGPRKGVGIAQEDAPIREPLELAPGARALVPTGFALELPEGYEGQVRPRSGLALRTGVTILNAPGTVDADYRGEVQVVLVNLGRETVMLQRGERIAQLVVARVERIAWDEVEELPATARGAGGFGSTGKQ